MNPKSINPRKRTGSILVFVGILLFGMGSMPNSTITDFGLRLVLMIVGSIIAFIGGTMNYRARQYLSKVQADKILNEGGPYVLYLRPFKTDSTIDSARKGASIYTGYQNLQSTMEEDLFKVLEPFGNLIAIGKPGEKLPTPGAARIYVEEEWKQVVIEKMKGAELVIILAGEGAGLKWELKEAIEILDSKKLLILIPAISKKAYESFRKEAAEKLNLIIPERSALRAKFGRTVNQYFIKFSKNMEPTFLPLRAPALKRNSLAPYQPLFTYALKPVFEEFGKEWQQPPTAKATIAGLISIGFFLLFFLVIGILALLHVI